MPRDRVRRVIGYYVHHHGRGHLHRAQSVAAALAEPVTVLSSLPPTGGDWYDGWLTLPRDDEGVGPVDVTAHGQLHWVPRGDAGLRDRMAALARWVDDARPSAVVVDVSVEVTAFLRLLGVPVVVMAQPGERDDGPHRLAYGLADRIVAPWRQGVYDLTWLAAHAAKTCFAGAWSRFDGRAIVPHVADALPRVLVLTGAGGTALTSDLVERYARDAPEFTWRSLGGSGGWIDDPWTELCAADVVVSHAGQNAVAEIAAARRPAILVPEERPFGEQAALAGALDAAGIVAALPGWPTSGAAWRPLVDDAIDRGADGWSRWSDPAAVGRAAAAIADVAVRG